MTFELGQRLHTPNDDLPNERASPDDAENVVPAAGQDQVRKDAAMEGTAEPLAGVPATGAGRRNDFRTEQEAMRIVREEEERAGWRVQRLRKVDERIEGCDFLSHPPDGGPPERVEVKGWSAPFRKVTKSGEVVFSYGSEVNSQQLERARSDPRWRLEIVANLAAVRAGTGEAQRLSLSGAEVVERAIPWKFRVPLDGLEARIK